MINFSKKLLAVALSVILIVSLVPASVFSVLAITPGDCADAPVLSLDTPTDVSYDGTEISGAFRFVPETDDNYLFYSSGTNDTYGKVMDENGNILVRNDDDGEDSNFKLRFSAEAGKTYYLLSQMYNSYNSGDYSVTLKKYESPIERVEVKSVDVVKDLSGNEYLDENDQEYFHYDYQSPEFTVYFNDGSSPRTGSYSMYIDGQYYYFEYQDDQDTNHWTDLGSYEVDYTFAGYKSTFTVNVVKNPVVRVEIEPVTVIKEQGGYTNYDWNTGEDYYYYNYASPKYTVYYDDNTNSETNSNSKQVLGKWYNLNRNDNQQNEHWTVGNKYTVPCTFAGIDCSYDVTVVDVPVSRIEVEDIVLTENTGGYMTTDSDNNDFYYYSSYSRPNFTVYWTDGTQTETDNRSKTKYGSSYSLEYNIDQYTTHFQPGQTYEIPCTFMGVECNFNVVVNPTPIRDVVIEDVTVIENIDGYERGYGDDKYFYYSYGTPKFTVYFNDGTEPVKSSYGSAVIGGQTEYLNYSDPQYENHFTLGENKVQCTFAGKNYEFTVKVIENPVESIEFEEITVYENMGGYTATDSYGNEYYRYNYNSPEFTLHFSDDTTSETGSGSKTVNGTSYYLNFEDNQEENHWEANNTYDVNWTFMNLTGVFKVKVEPNPVLRVEVDPITLFENTNGYLATNYSTGEQYYYYYISAPEYTVYYRNGGQSEKTTGYVDVNGNYYYLTYNIDQRTNPFKAGETYHIPCTFGGVETSFDIIVKKNPITRIEFDEVSVIENVSGYISYDGDDQEYFNYSYSMPSYTVYFDDNTNSGKISGPLEYNGNSYWPSYYNDGQYENHWTVGNTYQVTFTVMGFETSFGVTVKKTPVESVEVDKIVILENTSGRTDTDGDGEEYFRYNYRPQYVVHLEGGKTTNKTSYSTEVSGRYYNLEYNDTQYETHWETGNTYTVPFTFMGYSGTFEVEIKESPVKSVVIEPVEVIENISGYMDSDENGEYFHYNFSPKYTVYFKDNTHTATNEYNKTINGQSMWLTIYDEQNQNHWTVGNTYDVRYEFMGIECTSTVTVVKNPVKSVKVEDVTVIENTKGRYMFDETGTKYYNYSNFSPQFTITLDDNSVRTVVGSYQLGGSWEELEYDADQSETHWTVNNTYTVPCTFAGVESSFKVTVIPNPVTNVTASDVTLIENVGGYMRYDADNNRYFEYTDISPKFSVFFEDGSSSLGASGSVRVGNDWYGLDCSTNQYQTHWTVGNTYEVEYSFMGVSYGTFNVTIIPNPIKSITVRDMSVIENSNGYTTSYGDKYFVYRYSPVFDVTYTDDTVEENVYDSVQIGGRWYSLDCDDNQYEDHWTVGNTYEVNAALLGVSTTFNVSIIPTPVSRIEIEDVTLVENSNGWISTDNNSVEFYRYDYSPKYKVYFKDGSSTELTESGKQYGGKTYYLNNFEDDQYNNHWSVGNTYDVTAEFLGVQGSFKVTIARSTVKSIEVDDITVIENIGTWTMTDVNGNNYQRYPYGMPKYKVTFNNGSSTEKNSEAKEVLGQRYWLECQDNQDEVHWTVGNTYTVNCEFLGVKSTFKVTVKPISYFSSKIPSITVNTPKGLSYDGSVISGVVRFTPTETGNYNIYSTGKYYTDGYLYDSTGKQINEGFGNPTNPNFNIETELIGGSTYYILTQPFDGMDPDEDVLNFSVCATKSNTPLVCTHSQTETKNAVEATCTTAGYSGDIYCKVCGEKIANGRTVPALGHTGGIATCHSKAVCTRCGVEYGEFDEDNHDGRTEIRGEVEATCTENGYSGDTYCLSCGKMISSGRETPFAAHTVGDWLSDVGGHWHHCSQCDADVDHATHDYTWRLTKRPTAAENGLKEEICSICGYKSGNTEEVEYGGYEPGDINGDGETDNKDLTRLFQYLSDWGVEVNELALDVNGDGSVDNKDLTRLFQYLSDWGVEIF